MRDVVSLSRIFRLTASVDFEAKTGLDIPIHVDAASGGFIAPFTKGKIGGPKWWVVPSPRKFVFLAKTRSRNFELPRVKSINTSGHKFGLVYAGVGWVSPLPI